MVIQAILVKTSNKVPKCLSVFQLLDTNNIYYCSNNSVQELFSLIQIFIKNTL